jgi:purine nucleoside permease
LRERTGRGVVTLSPSVVVLPAVSESDNDANASEVAPWREAYDFTDTDVPGITSPVGHTDEVVLAPTGIGKAPAATTVTALVAGDGVDVSDATFVTVGIAGVPPASGTLGSVFVADSVVDWDPKIRVDDRLEPPRWNTEYVWDLDADLVATARDAVDAVDLADSPRAREIREAYDDDRTPGVGVGPTIGSDELYHGREITAEVEAFCRSYGLDGFATTEMESAGTAQALERFGLLDRYVSVRAVSNFDREPPGGNPDETVDEILFDLGIENAMRAGRAVVERLRGS